MVETRVIKKYPNRRLYDTHSSRYITLEDVHQLVISEIDFKVIDAKTQQDLTRSTILQILCDREDHDKPLLTSDLLQELIRFYDDPLHHMLSRYLEHSLDVFKEHQVQLKSPMNSILGKGTQSNLLHNTAESSISSFMERESA